MNDHPIIERLESSARDIGLIIADVKESDALDYPEARVKALGTVLNGMDTVLRDMKALRDDTQKAMDGWNALDAVFKSGKQPSKKAHSA